MRRILTARLNASEPGQILMMLAMGLFALMALLGIILDGGRVYVQRRTAQTMADAATFAGLRALYTATAAANTTIASEICRYALANSFGITPTVSAWFLDSNGADLQAINLPPGCIGSASNTIPNNASGVHVTPSMTFSTYLLGVIGQGNASASATAKALVASLTPPANAIAPVAACGNYMIVNPKAPASGDILIGSGTLASPYKVDPAAYGLPLDQRDFTLQGSQYSKNLNNHPPPDCPRDSGSSWKGTIDPGTGAYTLPASFNTVNGNALADINANCTATGQSVPDNDRADPPGSGHCQLFIPITGPMPDNAPGYAYVVLFSCMDIYLSNGTEKIRGVLVPDNECPSPTYTPGSWTFGGSDLSTQVRLSLTN